MKNILKYVSDVLFRSLVTLMVLLPVLLAIDFKNEVSTKLTPTPDTVYVQYIDTLYKTDTVFIIRDPETTVQKKRKIPKHVISYIESQMPYAQMLEDSFGINKWFALTQPAFESGWGTSRLAKHNKNLWGIKKCKGFRHDGKWAIFETLEQGWKKYAERILHFRKNSSEVYEYIVTIANSAYAGYGDDKEGVQRYIDNLTSVHNLIKSHLDD